MKKEVDFNIFKAQILDDIKEGKPLFGKDGALAPMIENLVNAVLEGEMDAHLTQESRNSMKYVGSKYQKEFMKDAGEMALDKLEEKWGEQYPIVIKSWRDNWDRLSEFFQYSETIRKLIYTTNTVEGYHRQIRKVTKNKGIFPNDTALIKLVYLTYRNARKK